MLNRGLFVQAAYQDNIYNTLFFFFFVYGPYCHMLSHVLTVFLYTPLTEVTGHHHHHHFQASS